MSRISTNPRKRRIAVAAGSIAFWAATLATLAPLAAAPERRGGSTLASGLLPCRPHRGRYPARLCAPARGPGDPYAAPVRLDVPVLRSRRRARARRRSARMGRRGRIADDRRARLPTVVLHTARAAGAARKPRRGPRRRAGPQRRPAARDAARRHLRAARSRHRSRETPLGFPVTRRCAADASPISPRSTASWIRSASIVRGARSSRAAAASPPPVPILHSSRTASPTSRSTTAHGWSGATTACRRSARNHRRSASRRGLVLLNDRDRSLAFPSRPAA
jgi:hypothetical protein